VERIEVLRGAAPVYFGTTAFAGTLNVIHYDAGSADRVTSVRFGSYQSGGAGGAAVLSAGRVRQSISAEVSNNNLSDPRARYARGIWRLATQLGGGNRADVDLLALRQTQQSGATGRSDRNSPRYSPSISTRPGQRHAGHRPVRWSRADGRCPRAMGQYGLLHPNPNRQRAWLHRSGILITLDRRPSPTSNRSRSPSTWECSSTVISDGTERQTDLTAGVNVLVGRLTQTARDTASGCCSTASARPRAPRP
jgi:hypothetical protein